MIKREIVIIGLGIFGMKLIEELVRQGASVIVVDQDINKINKVQEIVTLAFQIDSTDKNALERSGIKEVDVVIVGMGRDMGTSILTTKILKEMGIKEIIARASSSIHAKILKEIGADRVVFPEENIAQNLARSIIIPGVKEYIKLKGPWDLSEIEIGCNDKLVGEKLGDLKIRERHHVNILMITRAKKMRTDCEEEGEEDGIEEFPSMDYVLKKDDILVVYGEEKNLEKFEIACKG